MKKMKNRIKTDIIAILTLIFFVPLVILLLAKFMWMIIFSIGGQE